jgi:catechol 2,3-dioxygenase-like lactoylglutathione lyase family enzyme
MRNVRDYLGARFDQICFVTQDLDQSIAYWRKTNGVQNWAVAIDLGKHQTEKEYWGRPGDFQFSCAYGFSGETMIELARHDGGRSLYGDWIADKGYGVHHIGFRLPDSAGYEKAISDYESDGFVRAMGAYFQSPAGSCRWSYYDTREAIGCYTELYYLDGGALEVMERHKRGEEVQLMG